MQKNKIRKTSKMQMSLFLWKEIQIKTDVHSIVSDRSIHPHVIGAQKLHKQRCKSKSDQSSFTLFLQHSQNSEAVYLDLELQKLHILNGFFEHCANINLWNENIVSIIIDYCLYINSLEIWH